MYLNSIKENTGLCRQDVKTRIAMAKQKKTKKHCNSQTFGKIEAYQQD